MQKIQRLAWVAASLCVLGACSSDTTTDTGPTPDPGSGGMLDGSGDGETPGAGGGSSGSLAGSASADSAAAPTSAESGDADDGFTSSDPAAGAAGSGASEPIGDDIVEPPISNDPIQSGTLTAGTWDDNRNFDHFTRYRNDLLQQELPGALPTTDQEHLDAHELYSGEREANELLDVALVIDTTGSMGDEIAYLQAEFLDMSATIEDLYPNAEQRWSLVVYRDTTDEYVARWFDFRDSATEFRERLAEQQASGGGDFPEAPDAALEAMNQFAWRTGHDVARLAFWVADAPHHHENAQAMAENLRDSQMLDIHIYPVASSGVDELTELTMRSAAQLTGGRYLFLTDDSGVGGAHKEPSIPCYFVTRLDHAILRMVDIEMSGEYREPSDDELIRTSGDPQDGTCSLDSGQLQVF